MMNNSLMKESTTRAAVLEDVSVGTFTKFCEFAYTGTYSGTPTSFSKAKKKGPDDETTEFSKEQSINSKSVTESTESKLDASQASSYKTMSLTEIPVAGPKELLQLTVRLEDRFKSLQYSSKPILSTNMLIFSHARLYVFATKYLIEPLRQKCLSSIHQYLCVSFSQNIRGVLFLLRYIYSITSRYEPDGKSLLRDLVIQYAACQLPDIGVDEDLETVLEQNVDIAIDLLRVMTK